MFGSGGGWREFWGLGEGRPGCLAGREGDWGPDGQTPCGSGTGSLVCRPPRASLEIVRTERESLPAMHTATKNIVIKYLHIIFCTMIN